MAKVRKKVGRPSGYKPEYCQMMIDFFSREPFREEEITHYGKDGNEWIEKKEIGNPFPSLVHFARSIGVTYKALNDWSNRYPEFGDALKEAKALQAEFIATNGLKGLYNASFAIFTMKNVAGWRDVQELKPSDDSKIGLVAFFSMYEKG